MFLASKTASELEPIAVAKAVVSAVKSTSIGVPLEWCSVAPSASNPIGRTTFVPLTANGAHATNSKSLAARPAFIARSNPSPTLLPVQIPSYPPSAIITDFACKALREPVVMSNAMTPCTCSPECTSSSGTWSPLRTTPCFIHCSSRTCCVPRTIESPAPANLGKVCPDALRTSGMPSASLRKITPQRSSKSTWRVACETLCDTISWSHRNPPARIVSSL